MNDFFKTIQKFLTVFLPKQKCYSENTIFSYKIALNLFISFLRTEKGIPIDKIDFKIITAQIVYDFMEWLKLNRNNSTSTQNQRLNALRTFFKYASMNDCTLLSLEMDLKRIPLKKNHNKPVEYLSKNAIKALFDAPDVSTSKGIRNQFLMILMYDTAARCQEILDMKISDIIISKKPYVYLTGKGHKTRAVPIMEQTVKHFQNYLEIFHPLETRKEHDLLFYTTIHDKKLPMSPDTVAYIVKKYGNSVADEFEEMPHNIHPHQLRHSRAIHLYRDGIPLPLLAEFMGHKNINTTNIYAYADTEMKRKALEKITYLSVSETDTAPIWKNDPEIILKLCGLK